MRGAIARGVTPAGSPREPRCTVARATFREPLRRATACPAAGGSDRLTIRIIEHMPNRFRSQGGGDEAS